MDFWQPAERPEVMIVDNHDWGPFQGLSKIHVPDSNHVITIITTYYHYFYIIFLENSIYLIGPYYAGPNLTPAPLTPALITPVSKILFPPFKAGVKRAAKGIIVIFKYLFSKS